MFVDIHSHCDLYKDIRPIVQRAKEAGVVAIVSNGIDPFTNRQTLALSKDQELIKCAMGVYPRDALSHEAKDEPDIQTSYNVQEEIEYIKSHAKNIVAISEVGMDFVNGEPEEQYQDFKAMISLAKELDKPLVVHSRKAELQCIETLESLKAKNVVMHCFCGKKKLVQRIIDNGWSMSIPASVVRAQQFQMMVEMAPLTQLFCETDSPFLSPFPDKQNEPAFVVESYKMIAKIKGITLDDAAKAIYMNYQKMFL